MVKKTKKKQKTKTKIIDKRKVKVDLACGERLEEGWKGVDLFAKGPNVENFDLLQFPWPMKDESVDELKCYHFVEHIPMVFIDKDGCDQALATPGSTDAFLRFFAEVFRVLKPGGSIDVLVPYARHNRAFQDPTHRRFLVEESFMYLNKGWRKGNKLDHYLSPEHELNFLFAPGYPVKVVAQAEAGRHEEALAQRIGHMWNVVEDLRVILIKE